MVPFATTRADGPALRVDPNPRASAARPLAGPGATDRAKYPGRPGTRPDSDPLIRG